MRSHLRAAAALAAVLTGLAAGGCASTDRRVAYRDFQSGRFGEARASYEANLTDGDSDERALDLNLAGTAALVQGDVKAAHRHFGAAFDEMEDLSSSTGETLGAILGSESGKRWKGDAYERSMNAYYLGVSSWLLGDPDNAAAAFKTGLLRDAASRPGAAQSDFALLWFLLGMAQRDARHTDGGAAALGQAERLSKGLPSKAASEANLLVVLDVGLAPRKVPAGAHGSSIGFRRVPYATAHGAVFVDGALVGRTAQGLDVIDQAVDSRGGKMDAVNQGKAAVKDVSTVAGAVILDHADDHNERRLGAALLALGLLLPAEADVRQWDTLPGEVHVLAARLAPGRHRVRVEPRDGSDRPFASMAREFDVEIREGRVAFLWARATARSGGSGILETRTQPPADPPPVAVPPLPPETNPIRKPGGRP